MDANFWVGKKVFVTGHTGFKGGWLCLWLKGLGAKVFGYALSPPTTPSFFDVCGIEQLLDGHTIGDIRDLGTLKSAMASVMPDIVFHLAAQPLVRRSYNAPIETYQTNVIGTVNVLEAVRAVPSVVAIVSVTTDKCYENREWIWPYREDEALGGYDPYSSSKACAELVTSAYRRSFLKKDGKWVASARAGNVIGGGDWAEDRLVPDFFRATDAGRPLIVRSPSAIRPWQHVLEPLSGYIALAESLCRYGTEAAEAWNFGPTEAGTRTVQWILEWMCEHMPGASWKHIVTSQPHEAGTLKLDIAKAAARLHWSPRWNIEMTLKKTIDWHLAWKKGENMRQTSLQQIADYDTVLPV